MNQHFATWTFLLLLLLTGSGLWAQTQMKGRLYDRETRKPLVNAKVINLNSGYVFLTDSSGAFRLNVQKGQVVEFSMIGYQRASVEITLGSNLPFYSIGLRSGSYTIPDVKIKGQNFKSDSLEKEETYRWALDFYQLEGVDLLKHPFDAMSKQNRQIWAFQKRFRYFETQKFIDYVFNDKLIAKITGMEGELLQEYKRAYRPSYEQIQVWTTYEFYEYIKASGQYFNQHGQ